MYIYMGVAVILLHFQQLDTPKNCNTNLKTQTKFFQICLLTKYKFFYVNSKSKKNICCFIFSHFFVFLSLFQCFSSVSYYVKQFLDGLHLFWEDLFRFRGGHPRVLEKIQVQIIVLMKKLPWKFQLFSNKRVHHETLLTFVANFSQ